MKQELQYCSRVDRSLPIERRILNALIYIIHTRGQKPKAIYLTPEDYKLFTRRRRTWNERNFVDGLPVYIGAESKFYSESWWGRSI